MALEPAPGSAALRAALAVPSRLLILLALLSLAWLAGVIAVGLETVGSHYAPVRRIRSRWAADPSLHSLSYWPLGQGRIFGRPGSLSRVALLAVLLLPIGTPGQVALVIVAASIAAYSILSMSVVAAKGLAALDAAPIGA